LKDELPGGSRVGADPSLVPNSQWEILSKELSNGSIYLVPVKNNLVDQVWPNRPEYTKREAYVHEIEYAGTVIFFFKYQSLRGVLFHSKNNSLNLGKTWQHKVSAVRANMKAENCDAFVVTALDEIAWLLNIRGHDIPYLPVLRAYMILTRDQIHFYTDLNKLTPHVKRNLHSESCFSAFCAR
jgi:Xaa-Pro aminopeptidase